MGAALAAISASIAAKAAPTLPGFLLRQSEPYLPDMRDLVPQAGGVLELQVAGVVFFVSVIAQVTGSYTFQVGTDWGRGGASTVIDNATSAVLDEYVTTDDLWWANDWNNGDVFTSTVAMMAGESYTFGWVGFEGCCGGAASVRFSTDGGSTYRPLDSPAGDPFFVTNPEPGTGVLVMAGLAILAGRRRHR